MQVFYCVLYRYAGNNLPLIGLNLGHVREGDRQSVQGSRRPKPPRADRPFARKERTDAERTVQRTRNGATVGEPTPGFAGSGQSHLCPVARPGKAALLQPRSHPRDLRALASEI